ncbi:MAG: hypothetical protein IMZ47_06000 [Firmicutes bacterium]|nr:hypothetical protein [Bacillota bacterium]
MKAPKAAMDLVDALERSISRLERYLYSCRVYQPVEPLDDVVQASTSILQKI